MGVRDARVAERRAVEASLASEVAAVLRGLDRAKEDLILAYEDVKARGSSERGVDVGVVMGSVADGIDTMLSQRVSPMRCSAIRLSVLDAVIDAMAVSRCR